MLFILNSVPEIMEQYKNLTHSNYVPIPEPVTITSSLHGKLFFHYYKDYNADGVRVQFGIRLPNIYRRKCTEIDLRFNQMERIYQSLNFGQLRQLNSSNLSIIGCQLA